MGTFVTVVDAFTSVPFRGNPAAVCILDGPADDDWMQQTAREMNLAATAFCHADGELWDLRWFSPTVELELCGHATLATTHVLATDHGIEGTIRYTTGVGLLAAQAFPDGIILDFPADSTRQAEPPTGMLAALGVPDETPVRKGRASTYLVALADEVAVRRVRPTFSLLRRVDCRAVAVTAAADDGADYDVVSRFFAPSIGIDEDAVTGSAHCMLAPYWSARLQQDRLKFHQASARGGEMEISRVGESVEIFGQAVTTMRGEFAV
ncbi:MAG: PhzF family phenazine biosynthesis protein [Acidimicrobiales bacterium]|jgi:PhzF family phenazine biosynthesis protein|nr:PhzF family phenazine biosynthesis protein [Acidimicrobiales bacterium]